MALKIINIMSDNTVRESVAGLTIPNKEFYIIFNQIRSTKNEKENKHFE